VPVETKSSKVRTTWPPVPPVRALHGRTILVVGDDGSTCDGIADELVEAGATARAAVDGETAARVVATEVIDAIVCDLNARFDVYDWMRKIRALRDEAKSLVPALAISADQSALHLSPYHAASAGFDLHILLSRRGAVVEYLMRLLEDGQQSRTHRVPGR
jgi:CheY-like chemotaxis protein